MSVPAGGEDGGRRAGRARPVGGEVAERVIVQSRGWPAWVVVVAGSLGLGLGLLCGVISGKIIYNKKDNTQLSQEAKQAAEPALPADKVIVESATEIWRDFNETPTTAKKKYMNKVITIQKFGADDRGYFGDKYTMFKYPHIDNLTLLPVKNKFVSVIFSDDRNIGQINFNTAVSVEAYITSIEGDKIYMNGIAAYNLHKK